MAKINLRPWRAEQRKERQTQYLLTLVLVAGASLFASYSVQKFYELELENQQARNGFIEHEIQGLESKIKEIQVLREKRTQLLDRMKLIQELQGNRPVIVRFFDELAKIIPSDVYITDLKLDGNKISIKGRAISNKQISSFMRKFDESPWFENPNLLSVKAQASGDYNDFDMIVEQSKPLEEGEKNESK
jgi:type IV pilus assembly protein PilN